MKALLISTILALPSLVQVTSFAPRYEVQTVTASFASTASGTTGIPADDTIPQNTEGDERMTLAITPKSASNRLVIKATAWVSADPNRQIGIALFQDTGADAIAASVAAFNADNIMQSGSLIHVMTAGTTSSTTFKIRVGQLGSGSTAVFNGNNTGRMMGDIPKSTLTITEILP